MSLKTYFSRAFFAGILFFFCAIGLNAQSNAESPGPASRRTGLVISEIMYHPLDRPDGKNLEFLELYNSEAISLPLGSYRIAGDINYTFPSNTVINAGQYLVIAAS